jgi:predicted nucleic acid-binding protein
VEAWILGEAVSEYVVTARKTTMYREHDIGLVDATILATAERLDAPRILTLDHRHFRTLKLRNRRSVTIVPADARRR